jgi:uncharacterized damage-inducible protein DinB
MDFIQNMIQELEQESQATRRLLECVPEDKLTWKPHASSMTLGQLAQHVASIPAGISGLLKMDGFDAQKASFTPPQPESTKEVLAAFEAAIPTAKELLSSWDEATALSKWSLTHGEKEVFSMPRMSVARTVMMNHLYHHRGQLTVYLRLLDVPLPVTYGRSADTNPFG